MRRGLELRRKRTLNVRDVLAQPFVSTSIWNTPIGSSAHLVSSGLGPSPADQPKLKTDEIFIGVNPLDPLLPLDDTPMANGNNVGASYNIATGTKVRVPSGMTHGGTWNGIAAFLDSDGRHVWQGQPLYLRDGSVSSKTDLGSTAGPRWANTFPRPPALCDLYGDGLVGIHGASHLGGLGGSLRAWEWNGTGNIQHVLALNVFSRKYLYRAGLDNTTGFRWPATRADGSWNGTSGASNNNYYGGTVADMKMGALLCLPDTFDLSTVTDPQARRIAWTLQNFGCYIVDATGFNEFYSISAETTVVNAIKNAGTAFHAQALALMPLLQVVSNNDVGSIGGGGTPRVTPPTPVSA